MLEGKINLTKVINQNNPKEVSIPEEAASERKLGGISFSKRISDIQSLTKINYFKTEFFIQKRGELNITTSCHKSLHN